MIPKSAIHWHGLVTAVSSYRCKKQIPRRRSREHGGSSCPETITQPATAVPVLKLYYQRTKIQPAAGHGRSSTEIVLPENKKSIRPPETAVPVLNLYYQRTKIQPVDACRGYCSSRSGSSAGNSKHMGRPAKRLSRVPQLTVRKHAGNPKHQGDAILECLFGDRNALGQGPSTLLL